MEIIFHYKVFPGKFLILSSFCCTVPLFRSSCKVNECMCVVEAQDHGSATVCKNKMRAEVGEAHQQGINKDHSGSHQVPLCSSLHSCQLPRALGVILSASLGTKWRWGRGEDSFLEFFDSLSLGSCQTLMKWSYSQNLYSPTYPLYNPEQLNRLHLCHSWLNRFHLIPTLICAFVTSTLNYYNDLQVRLPLVLSWKHQLMQNAAAHMLMGANKYDQMAHVL